MLNEPCPACGRRMGWRGPRVDDRLGRRSPRGPVRWLCGHCGAALRPAPPRAQRVAQGAMALGLGLTSVLGLLNAVRVLPDAPLGRWLALAASGFTIVACVTLLAFLLTRRQWARDTEEGATATATAAPDAPVAADAVCPPRHTPRHTPPP